MLFKEETLVIKKLQQLGNWSLGQKIGLMICLLVLLGIIVCAPLLSRLSNTFFRGEQTNASSSDKIANPVANSSGNLIAWRAFDGGGERSGINAAESILTTSNVGKLTRLWQQKLPVTADGAPIELPSVPTAGGIKTLLYVTTTGGSLLAIDAADGSLVWRKNTSGPKFTTSSPALDPSEKFVYSYGLDGKVHKYAVGDGEEVVDKTWPAVVTLMPVDEKGSSPINIANGYLYMAIAGYPGDGGYYEGHIVAINLENGSKTVFNALCANIRHVLNRGDCADVQSAIWGRGAPTIDPVTGNVFVATGNGAFRGDGRSYGDSIVELSRDLGKVVDSYTPAIFEQLQARDQDLGSAVPAILPRQAGSKTPLLMVQAGKDSMLRLINRENLSGQGRPNRVGGEVQTIQLPIKGVIVTHPLAWNDMKGGTWVFVANTYYFFAYKVLTDTRGKTTLRLAYQNKNGGSSPFLAHNILFEQGKGVIRAMEPTTGKILWSSTQASAGGSIGKMHWQSPIVVNGHVYVPDDSGYLSAYGLK